VFDSPVCSKNLSSDIIGSASGRFIVGQMFGQQANISGEHGRQKMVATPNACASDPALPWNGRSVDDV
jgi:hypothetical protein